MHETGKDAICLLYVDFYGIKICTTFDWSIYPVLYFCITSEELQV